MSEDVAYLGQPFATSGADGSMDVAYQGQPFVDNNTISDIRTTTIVSKVSQSTQSASSKISLASGAIKQTSASQSAPLKIGLTTGAQKQSLKIQADSLKTSLASAAINQTAKAQGDSLKIGLSYLTARQAISLSVVAGLLAPGAIISFASIKTSPICQSLSEKISTSEIVVRQSHKALSINAKNGQSTSSMKMAFRCLSLTPTDSLPVGIYGLISLTPRRDMISLTSDNMN